MLWILGTKCFKGGFFKEEKKVMQFINRFLCIVKQKKKKQKTSIQIRRIVKHQSVFIIIHCIMMKCFVEIQLNNFNCQCDGIIRQNKIDLNGGQVKQQSVLDNNEAFTVSRQIADDAFEFQLLN